MAARCRVVDRIKKKKGKKKQRKNSLFSFPACWSADKRDQRRCSSASAVTATRTPVC